MTSRRAVSPLTVRTRLRGRAAVGASASALTSPMTLGTNVGSIVPLVASKAKMLSLVRVGPPPGRLDLGEHAGRHDPVADR